MKREHFLLSLAGIIIFVWVFAFLFGAYRRDYTALSLITPVVATLIGVVFVIKRNGNGGDK